MSGETILAVVIGIIVILGIIGHYLPDQEEETIELPKSWGGYITCNNCAWSLDHEVLFYAHESEDKAKERLSIDLVHYLNQHMYHYHIGENVLAHGAIPHVWNMLWRASDIEHYIESEAYENWVDHENMIQDGATPRELLQHAEKVQRGEPREQLKVPATWNDWS